jgi:hypothetical protein
LSPSGCRCLRDCPSGHSRVRSSECSFFRILGSGRFGSAGNSLPVGTIRRDAAAIGGTRGQVLVENLKRGDRLARVCLTRMPGNALERRASGLSESGRLKRMKEGAGKPAPRPAGKNSGEATKPRRASVSRGSRVAWDADPRREQAPGAAGHRGLLILRAGERDVRNGMRGHGAERRTALRGDGSSEG